MRDFDIYTAKQNKLFKCLKEDKEIGFDRINDDFCDCTVDG